MAYHYIYSSGNNSGSGFTSNPATTANWTNAWTSVASAITNGSPGADDILFIADDHNESTASGISLLFPTTSRPCSILCVNRTSGLASTGAQVSTTGNSAINIQGFVRIAGVIFKSGNSTGTANIGLCNGNTTKHWQAFENCTFYVGSSNAGSGVVIGSAGTATNAVNCEINNCQFRYSNASQGIDIALGRVEIYNCKIHASSTAPTRAFRAIGHAILQCSACDWSAATNIHDVGQEDGFGFATYVACKSGTNLITGTQAVGGSNWVEFHACSAGDHNYDYFVSMPGGVGTIEEDTSIYPNSGAATGRDNNGSTYSYTYKLSPGTNICDAFPLKSPWVYLNNALTGSRQVAMEIVYDSGTALNDGNCYLEVEGMVNNAAANTSMYERFPGTVGATGIYRDYTNASWSSWTNTNASYTGTSGFIAKKTATISTAITVNEQGPMRARLVLTTGTTVYLTPRPVVS